MNAHKKCKICQTQKDVCCFNKAGKHLSSYCKICISQKNKKDRKDNPEKYTLINKKRWEKKTIAEKRAINSQKKYVTVKCKDCSVEWSKRKDTILTWMGRCRSCSMLLVETTPERKAIKHQIGLAFIKKFGKLNAPKMENRGRRETHYNWKGGITPFRIAFWQSKEHKEWRKSVFERDDYKCVICNVNTHDLQADHIKPFALYPELRLDVNNGRTLCIPCHIKYGARVHNGKLTRESSNGTIWKT